MGVKVVPETFVYTCDACGAEHKQNSSGRPPHWSRFTFARDAHDYQGVAVADGTVEQLLCPDCTAKLDVAIVKAFAGEQ